MKLVAFSLDVHSKIFFLSCRVKRLKENLDGLLVFVGYRSSASRYLSLILRSRLVCLQALTQLS